MLITKMKSFSEWDESNEMSLVVIARNLVITGERFNSML